MKITTAQLRAIVKEEAKKAAVNEAPFFGGLHLPYQANDLSLVSQFLLGAITGTVTATLIGAGLLTHDFIKKAKNAISVWKRGGELKPEVVKGIVSDFKKRIADSKLEKGQKAYLMRFVNRLEKADPKDKAALKNAEDALIQVAKDWRLQKENMKITTEQLRAIVKEEIVRIREEKTNPAETIQKHQAAIAKLEKAMSAAKTQTQKDAIQKRMVTRKQWLANFKKRLTGK